MRTCGAPGVGCCLVGSLLLVVGSPQAVSGQGLNWEGQTGIFVTPSAYLAASPQGSMGRPAVSFHVLDAGQVLGVHFQMSATIGFSDRVEFGLTRSAVSSVGPQPVASLFDRGFTTIHGKMKLLSEDAGGRWRPALAVGAAFRWQHEHIRDEVASDATENGDVYVVITKTAMISENVAVTMGGGLKATKASFMGISGNVPDWEARAFGSGGVLLGGRLYLGGEILQQPGGLDGFPDAEIPSSIAGVAQVSPLGSGRLTVDVGLVRLAGVVEPGVDLKAERVLSSGLTFRF